VFQLKVIRCLIANILGQLGFNWKKLKKEGLKWTLTKTESWTLFIIFFLFPGKTSSVTSFTGAFNAPNVHQICQNLHETDHQTSLYVGVWFSPARWQINGRGTTPKRPTQAACSCRFDNLTVHHAYFEPTVGILFIWIKGCKFSLV